MFVTQTYTTANNSNVTFTVPTGQNWSLVSGMARLVTTATAGARVLRVQWEDASANVLCTVQAHSAQTASLTYDYSFAQGVPSATQSSSLIVLALPQNLWIPATYVIRVIDTAAIDAAADDFTIRLVVNQIPGTIA